MTPVEEIQEAERRDRERNAREAQLREAEAADEKAREDEATANLAAMEARTARALQVLQKGDPLQYLTDVYSQIHAGDREALQAIVLAVACQSIINSQGIQPRLGGDAGSGKTSAVRAALHLIPPDWIMEGSVSDKAFFRFLDTPGRIVFIDETGEMGAGALMTIKRAMSNFQEPTLHRTLDKDQKPLTVRIAPRQLFLFTAVGDFGDEQLADRFLMISLKKTPENDQAYLKFTIDQAEEGTEDYPLTDDVMTCRAMIEKIKGQLFRVKLPDVEKVRFTNPGQRRDVRIYLDLVKALAALRFMQRKRYRQEEDPENVNTLEADPLDYRDALEVFLSMGPRIQDLKLSKDEAALWEFITVEQNGEVTFPDLVERYGGTYSKVRRLLEGRPDRDGGTGGLQGKIPGLTITHEIRETPAGHQRQVKVIRCKAGRPGLANYIPLVILPAGFGDLIQGRREGELPDPSLDQGITNGEEPSLILSGSKNGQEPKTPDSKKERGEERDRSLSLSLIPNTSTEREKSKKDPESRPHTVQIENGTREQRTTKEPHYEPETENLAHNSLQNSGSGDGSGGSRETPDQYDQMTREQLTEILFQAGNNLARIPNLEAFKAAWRKKSPTGRSLPGGQDPPSPTGPAPHHIGRPGTGGNSLTDARLTEKGDNKT